MTHINPRIAHLEMPRHVQSLPLNPVGYPAPWFVATVDGVPDFRVIAPGKIEDALRFKLCWTCGNHLGSYAAFLIGPMCVVNRISAEPPSHRDCATYAAQACPFLATPGMVRRTTGLPEDRFVPGVMVERNPGVALVWTTRTWRPFAAPNGGLLFEFGDPTSAEWFAEGREATHAEVLASIDSGMPTIREAADIDGPAAHAMLDKAYDAAMQYVPEVAS